MNQYGPSRRRAENASAALRIFVRCLKKTFATIIGAKRTSENVRLMSSLGREAVIPPQGRDFRFCPKGEIGAGRPWLCIAYVRTPSSGVGSDRDLDLLEAT